jgi:hypothetical protein
VHLLLLLCAKQLLLHLLLALALAIFGPCAPPPSPPWHAQRAAATARVLVGFARHSVPGKYIGRRGVCDVMVVVPGRVVVVAAEVVVAGWRACCVSKVGGWRGRSGSGLLVTRLLSVCCSELPTAFTTWRNFLFKSFVTELCRKHGILVNHVTLEW